MERSRKFNYHWRVFQIPASDLLLHLQQKFFLKPSKNKFKYIRKRANHLVNILLFLPVSECYFRDQIVMFDAEYFPPETDLLYGVFVDQCFERQPDTHHFFAVQSDARLLEVVTKLHHVRQRSLQIFVVSCVRPILCLKTHKCIIKWQFWAWNNVILMPQECIQDMFEASLACMVNFIKIVLCRISYFLSCGYWFLVITVRRRSQGRFEPVPGLHPGSFRKQTFDWSFNLNFWKKTVLFEWHLKKKLK